MVKKAKKAAKAKRSIAKSPAKKASTRRVTTVPTAGPLGDPVVRFMCFSTPDSNVFEKCEWSPRERRFTKNCRLVGRDECVGSE
jgi:hypothetical protein